MLTKINDSFYVDVSKIKYVIKMLFDTNCKMVFHDGTWEPISYSDAKDLQNFIPDKVERVE